MPRPNHAHSILPPTHHNPLHRVSLQSPNPRRRSKPEKCLLPIRQRLLDVLSKREVRVLLRTHKRAHEQKENYRPLGVGTIGSGGVPEARLEDEGGAGGA